MPHLNTDQQTVKFGGAHLYAGLRQGANVHKVQGIAPTLK
jgi:hypothetical protein